MKRITIVDSLRGFSLLGIFLANLLIFQFSLSGKDYIEHFHLSPVNQGIFNLIIILVEESFYLFLQYSSAFQWINCISL